ncbi:MAG: Nramp family divalent metal transporter [Ignavibacteriaceae bacterium]|nr:Nramp family divalent metal transporter [Ignavibacteriaceae bacterium]
MDKSLSEVHSSVKTDKGSYLKRLFAFSGPAFLVSVGYMDPGNWATDIAGGAQFGYKLIWVILLANMMAILFQTLAARLGIVYGRDLAQACRSSYPKSINFILWIFTELAIAATDLAEVLGSAIGLYLLFGIPLVWGVVITTLDVLLLLLLINYGIRKMEAVIVSLVAMIGICFLLELVLAKPDFAEVATGFMPTAMSSGALFIALGIIGATVMPHNIYLHSALVQSRDIEKTTAGKKEANKFNLIDSVVALNAAFFVNAAILILAASVFFSSGHSDVASIMDAHSLLGKLLGSSFAPFAFGLALLAAGQSSTITGTFAGQIIMEGFVGLKVRPWVRRLITRLIAIIPALIVINLAGDRSVDMLLILSQVILSIQLPFALIPLLHFTSSKEKMGEFASGTKVKILAWSAAILIVALNLKLVSDVVLENISNPGTIGLLIKFLGIPFFLFVFVMLLWITFEPILTKEKIQEVISATTAQFASLEGGALIQRVGIALEGKYRFDSQIIQKALPFLQAEKNTIYLMHCVESPTGRFLGESVDDQDALRMRIYLEKFSDFLNKKNFKTKLCISGGEPEDAIAKLVEKDKIEMIILGSHGHKLIDDMILGSTVDELRHKVRVPILAIPVN